VSVPSSSGGEVPSSSGGEADEDGTDTVPKRRLLIFRRRGNTQKTIFHDMIYLTAIG
jgi:hypothetical protein